MRARRQWRREVDVGSDSQNGVKEDELCLIVIILFVCEVTLSASMYHQRFFLHILTHTVADRPRDIYMLTCVQDSENQGMFSGSAPLEKKTVLEFSK